MLCSHKLRLCCGHSAIGGNPPGRIVNHHLFQQVDGVAAHVFNLVLQVVRGPVGEGGLVVRQTGHAGPDLLRRRLQNPKTDS
jgi:hypothetical protein